MTTADLSDAVLRGGGGVDARAMAPSPDAARRDDEDDASLVKRATSGDRRAEELLYVRHLQFVGSLLFRLLGDRADAEDAIQESFVIALDRLSTLRDPSAFRPWLAQIAVSQARRRFRRQRLLRVLGIQSGQGESSNIANVAEPDGAQTEWIALGQIVAKLAANERIAWSLRHVQGYELEEVASACACSLSTAKRRIASADEWVRRHFGIREALEGRT
jgi:RNA polymerase sigma-70 factor (ECF subfamily)